ncbi:BsaA family SipW-dependent biofilm matrix protein [Hespellia stercorisuis]|uniref:Alternate signal-mediated exported protein, CPF_0494 family n=1 Tax=Hespellia stercorisuis DSM 15480 TaxID=1121950 RepID=A0A1M6I9A1_9FIRM|nr:BsaA family SipW-dependent biofilm matrix protein [Hespellia stercorisuis]SHJ30976.1 alternate signal-mediated exported protein, CPF_0494 family [Hespellia stercorisuis DSM 15480]
MRNKKLAAVTGVAAIAIIGGSLAYFNQSMTVENPFDTSKYATELVEDFHPGDGDNWEPGSEVNKDIEIQNTGDYDVITRVKFDETWTRKDGTVAYVDNTGINNTTSQTDPADGLTTDDYSVVAKNLINSSDWFYNESDGYYYYLKPVKAGENTGKFLDSVTLLENADMGVYSTVKYYTTAETAPANTVIGTDPETSWAVYTGDVPTDAKHTRTVSNLDSDKQGYADSDYKLTITAQTVQATKDAVGDAFNLTSVTGSTWGF